jgi:phosphatidate cytidylyltransferase
MHLKRWITGIIAVPLLFAIIYKGGTFLFLILLGVVCILSLAEYFNIVLSREQRKNAGLIPYLAYIFGPLMLYLAHRGNFNLMLASLGLNLILAALLSLRIFKRDHGVVETVMKELLGLVYIAFSLSFLVLIRHTSHGVNWIFFILSTVAAGDIGAYYCGSYLGKHKLCPSVSPNKTIEGSLGGLASNLGMGLIFQTLFLPFIPLWGALLFALAVGVAGQIGDLFESEFKRAGGIKDSGMLLPGHGGFLDRIDALLFAAPIAFLIRGFLV